MPGNGHFCRPSWDPIPIANHSFLSQLCLVEVTDHHALIASNLSHRDLKLERDSRPTPSQSSARCALFLVRENSSDPPSLLASGGLKMSALRTSHVNNFPVMSTLFPILISITSKNVHDIGHSGRRRCCPSLRTFSMLSDLHDFFKLRNLYDLLYAPEHFSGAMSA